MKKQRREQKKEQVLDLPKQAPSTATALPPSSKLGTEHLGRPPEATGNGILLHTPTIGIEGHCVRPPECDLAELTASELFNRLGSKLAFSMEQARAAIPSAAMTDKELLQQLQKWGNPPCGYAGEPAAAQLG